ncbi:tRNA pseudouridine synthase-like 1 isoform X4 [Crotalus tigris]|uniref:tRNA pseudouridine synthase-like 1 isoform X4 n=1 Tax=Crotalus tigris TaxID=88082 RepID=UPI00192F939C|nr:tRNA pseudouridine synthase-like 1 isoform X4 [Crotalus tigris]
MNSTKTRYLIFFQYFGAKYSGVKALPSGMSAVGVENHLEKAAENLRASEPIKFAISSRTDAGVHALCNTAHLDVQRKEGQPPFSEDVLVQVLNKHLLSEPIRVLSACRVSSNFHARFSARARTYVYRVATGCTAYSDLPVFERDLCWANWRGHLNLAAMQEAATFLMGTHDFSTFCSASSEMPVRSPIKSLNWVEVRPARGFLSEHSQDSNLKFWELEFVSRSFLYKQVRRMVGALVAVGQNRLQPHHIKELLAARDLMAYPHNTMAPPDGLFLKHVEYYKSDLETED